MTINLSQITISKAFSYFLVLVGVNPEPMRRRWLCMQGGNMRKRTNNPV